MTVNYVLPGKIAATQQPALPFAPDKYSRQYHDQLNTILRLYFAQFDNFTSNLLSNDGGRFLGFPHLAAHDSASQYATANNKEIVVNWTVVDSGSGFTLNDGTGAAPVSSATASYSGVYKIDYSLQFVNTDAQDHDVYVWLRVNGTNVIESASKFTIPSKHGAVAGAAVAYSSVTFRIEAGQYVELYWSTTQAYIASPLQEGVYMLAEPAQIIGTPPNTSSLPSIPSAIGTIACVSNIPA